MRGSEKNEKNSIGHPRGKKTFVRFRLHVHRIIKSKFKGILIVRSNKLSLLLLLYALILYVTTIMKLMKPQNQKMYSLDE